MTPKWPQKVCQETTVFVIKEEDFGQESLERTDFKNWYWIAYLLPKWYSYGLNNRKNNKADFANKELRIDIKYSDLRICYLIINYKNI